MTTKQIPLFDGTEKKPDKKRREKPKLLDRFSQAIQARHYSCRREQAYRR